VLKTLDAAIAAGTLRIEAGATKISLRGTLGADGVVADPLQWDFQVHVPGNTTASTGVPDGTLDQLGFELMGGGTPQSHIHVRRSITKAEVFQRR
jgi:hypothetical protein